MQMTMGIGLGAQLGRLLGGAGWPIVNRGGLARWNAALADADTVVPSVWCVGDSITWGAYRQDGVITSEDDARAYSYPAKLSDAYGEVFGQESGFLAAAAASPGGADSLVTVSGAPLVTSMGLASFSRSLVTGQTISFAVPASTAVDIIVWESDGTNGQPNTGTFTYAIDGAAAVAVAKNGTVAGYRAITLAGLANTGHTVLLTGTSAAQVYVIGVRHRALSGVCVGRFGRPGWTSNDILGKGSSNSLSAQGQIRVLDAFGMGTPKLVIIAFGANDCPKQLTDGTTPVVFKANIQAMADKAVAADASVLLMSHPLPPYAAPAGGSPYEHYWQAADEVAAASQHIAHIRINDLPEWRGAEKPIADGLQNIGSVHPTIAGYANIGAKLASLLGNLSRL